MFSYLHLIIRSIQRRFYRLKFTFAAITLSVAVLIVLNGLITGVSDTMIENAISIQAGHVQGSWNDCNPAPKNLLTAAQSIPNVRAALLRTRNTGIFMGPDNQMSYAMVYGVDPALESKQTIIAQRIVEGSYLNAPGQIIVGRRTAEELNLHVGKTVRYVSKKGDKLSYAVVGIFSTGLGEMDHMVAFAFMDKTPCDTREISLFLNSDTATPAASARLDALLAETGACVQTWRETMPDLVQLITLNKVSTKIVMVLVLGILALGILNTIYISVSERAREFGILKTIGVTPAGITLLVLAETFLLVSTASLLGILLGVTGTAIWVHLGGLDVSPWTDMNPLFLRSSVIIPRLELWEIILPGIVATCCGLFAGFLPASKAGRIVVLETMRQV